MTYRTIGVELEDAVYQRAILKALRERRTINQVVADLLTTYAGPAPVPVTPVTTPTPVTPETPATPVTPTTAQPVVSQPQVYTVQSGDTLGVIARRIYGSARYYPQIQQANNIQDPRRIWVGQRLTIPVIEGITANMATTTSAPSQPVSSPVAPAPTAVPTTPVTLTSSGSGLNPKPAVQFISSPNFNRRPQGEISAIVVHATANSTLNGVIAWFNNPTAQVSAHYTIGKDGAIVQHVQDRDRAWHAGRSSWEGRQSLNDWSIGIELVNLNNGQDPYPEVQHQANVNLIAYLVSQYGINPDLILAHYDVSPDRKTDPKGYDMDRLRREVAART